MNKFMQEALKESEKALKKGEIPVGAVIEKDGKIISKAHNNRQKGHNVLGHAEINAILKAEKTMKDWRLDGCNLYVTLEPCKMCDVIIKESRISNVYYLLTKIDEDNIEDIEVKNYQNKLRSFFEKMR